MIKDMYKVKFVDYQPDMCWDEDCETDDEVFYLLAFHILEVLEGQGEWLAEDQIQHSKKIAKAIRQRKWKPLLKLINEYYKGMTYIEVRPYELEVVQDATDPMDTLFSLLKKLKL